MKINDTYSIEFQIQNRLINDEFTDGITSRLAQDLNIVLTGIALDNQQGATPQDMEERTKKIVAFDKFTKETRALLYQYFVYDKKILSTKLCNELLKFKPKDYEDLFQAYTDNNTQLYAKVFQKYAEIAFSKHVMEEMSPHFFFKDIAILKTRLLTKYPYCPADKIDTIDNSEIKYVCLLNVVEELKKSFPQQIHDRYQRAKKEYEDMDHRHILIYEIIDTILVESISEKLLVDKLIDERYKGMLNMCQQEQAKHMNRKLDVFLTEQKIYYGAGDSGFDQEMIQYVQTVIDGHPNLLLNSSIKHRYKTKSFYQEAKQGYINAAETAFAEVVKQDTQILSNKDIYTAFDAQFFNRDNYIASIKTYLKKLILDFSQERQNKIFATVTKKKEQIVATPINQENTTLETKKLTGKQEELLNELEQRMQDRVTVDINYIRRMLKKGSAIYLESLTDDMGQGYSAEMLTELLKILYKLDVDVVTTRDTEIEKMLSSLPPEQRDEFPRINVRKTESTSLENPPDINPLRNESIVMVDRDLDLARSATLQAIKDSPEKVTTQVLITICKELGYRFWDEKEFAKYADKFGLDKEGRVGLRVKKKIIDMLNKPKDVVWKNRGNARSPNYQRIDLNDGIRLIKQKKTVLWICDHTTYIDLINKHFTQNKTDFDAQLNMTTRDENFDPTCA